MAKTKKTTKSATREPRFWNQTYTFKKAPKVEPAPETIGGIVYRCIQKLKTADATQITDAAVKLGIGERSGQDPRNQVLIFLRRFAADGIVTITKETGSAKAASPKAASKTRKAGKGKPKFKLAKSASASAEASA